MRLEVTMTVQREGDRYVTVRVAGEVVMQVVDIQSDAPLLAHEARRAAGLILDEHEKAMRSGR